MYVYHNVALSVAPKRAALAAAQAQLDATMAALAGAQAKLAAVEEKIRTLEASFEEAVAKKASLAQQVLVCTVKLQRADKLIGGLGGEKVRWQATVERLGRDLVNVVGDVVVAAASIAYAGPFTPTYRAALVAEWAGLLLAKGVPHTPNTNLIQTLQDPVKVRRAGAGRGGRLRAQGAHWCAEGWLGAPGMGSIGQGASARLSVRTGRAQHPSDGDGPAPPPP